MNIKIGQNEFTPPFTVKLENGFHWIVDADGRDLFEDEEAAAKAVADALNDYWRKVEDELPENGDSVLLTIQGDTNRFGNNILDSPKVFW